MLNRKVVGFHFGNSETALATYRYDLLSTLAYFSYSVDPNTGLFSSLNGWDSTTAVDIAHENGAHAVLVASNFGADENRALLSDSAKRTILIRSLVQQVQSQTGDGVLIDFEGVPPDASTDFTVFMTELAAELRNIVATGEIACALPAIPQAAYDLSALSEVCDYVVIMAYDYSYASSRAAGPVAPLNGPPLNVTSSILDYLTSDLRPAQVLLGVPYYGFDWKTINTTPHAEVVINENGIPVMGTARTYLQNARLASQYGRVFDSASSSPYYTYIDSSGQAHVAWYDDPTSLAFKYSFAQSKDIGGIAIWNLAQGRDAPELWQAIADAFATDACEI